MEFENKRIVVTGASSGIGWELLKQLYCLSNVQLVAVDLLPLPEELNGVSFIKSDLAKIDEIENMFAQVLFKFEAIDIFFANAGFAYYETVGKPNYEHIDKIFRVNTIAPIYILQKMMSLGNENLTVFTTSAMAKLGIPNYALYGATKAALDRFADAFWYEKHPKSKLTLVYPVATRTNFFINSTKDKTPVIPWPSQTAKEVSVAIIKGVRLDKRRIFPSKLFRIVRFPQWLFEQVSRPYQWFYKK